MGEAHMIMVDQAGPGRDYWVYVSDLELQGHVEDQCVMRMGFRLGSIAFWILGESVGWTKCETCSLRNGLGVIIYRSGEGSSGIRKLWCGMQVQIRESWVMSEVLN